MLGIAATWQLRELSEESLKLWREVGDSLAVARAPE
jgi:hypothetical protein